MQIIPHPLFSPLPFIFKLQTPTQLVLKSNDVGFGIHSSAAFLHPHMQLADRVNAM